MTSKLKRGIARLFLSRARTPAPPLEVPVDWRTLLSADAGAWEQARLAAKGGHKVLIATSLGGHPAVTLVESMLGIALTLRGAEVHFLLCDRFLSACMLSTFKKGDHHAGFVTAGPQSYLCDRCYAAGKEIFEPLGLPIHRYSELVTPDQRQTAKDLAQSTPFDEIPRLSVAGMAVGEHALAGALRYFARGALEGEPDGEAVLRRYLEAGLQTTYATSALLVAEPFEVACFHHGIYVPQGLVGEVARSRGVRVVNWNPAYRKHCFIFSHHDTYHHTLLDEPSAVWEDMTWGEEMEQTVMDYLHSRWYGTQDWIWFHENPQDDLAKISAEVGIDFAKPTIGLLTNVMWDAQLHYPANAFPDMLAWVLQTIAYFAGRPDLQLVIRVHPAEIRGTIPSRQKIVDEIASAYPELPANVFVIPPESNVSTYAVTLHCDTVIIYGTKTGVELTSFGVPVIVAGEAWIRNKGVTMDASSLSDYVRLLDRLPVGGKLDEFDPEARPQIRLSLLLSTDDTVANVFTAGRMASLPNRDLRPR